MSGFQLTITTRGTNTGQGEGELSGVFIVVNLAPGRPGEVRNVGGSDIIDAAGESGITVYVAVL